MQSWLEGCEPKQAHEAELQHTTQKGQNIIHAERDAQELQSIMSDFDDVCSKVSKQTKNNLKHAQSLIEQVDSYKENGQ